MADCTAAPLCMNLKFGNKGIRYRGFVSHLPIAPRNCSFGCSKIVLHPTWRFYKISASNFKGSHSPGKIALRPRCLGTLINADGAAAFEYIFIADQVLLILSAILTCTAGVTPAEKSYLKPGEDVSYGSMISETSTSSGSIKTDEPVNFKYALDVVKRKLIDSLTAVQLEGSLGKKLDEFDQHLVKRPLSLYAIAKGPRLRLLWASFQQLEKEVNESGGSLATINMDSWLPAFYKFIQKACLCICIDWLEKEISLNCSGMDKVVFGLIVEKFRGDETILQNIKLSSKEDLYAELLCFLKFGSLRIKCCNDKSLFILNGVAILEDLLITLADGIVSIYLELISIDGNISNEMYKQGLFLCTLSTRELQKLRNEVLLNQWLYQNLEAVVSMYEDRFDLLTFENQFISVSSNLNAPKFSFWKRLTLKSQPVLHQLSYAAIIEFRMPVKRARELRALTGWRYYFSLFLELADIAMPMIRAVSRKVSEAISFFLVCLIGRSLGLIYSGIRQSVRWK